MKRIKEIYNQWDFRLSEMCIYTALAMFILKIFLGKAFLGHLGWIFFVVALIFKTFWACKIAEKSLNKIILDEYEIDQLRYSYNEMGKYVKEFEFYELSDIDLRIENELRDIEVRKKWFAKSHGIKE